MVSSNSEVWPAPNNGRVTVLLMGVDARGTIHDPGLNTDVMTLITIDPISQTAALLVHPARSLCAAAGHGCSKSHQCRVRLGRT